MKMQCIPPWTQNVLADKVLIFFPNSNYGEINSSRLADINNIMSKE